MLGSTFSRDWSILRSGGMRRFSGSKAAASAAIACLLLTVPSQNPGVANHIELRQASASIPQQVRRSQDWRFMLLFSIPLIIQIVRRR